MARKDDKAKPDEDGGNRVAQAGKGVGLNHGGSCSDYRYYVGRKLAHFPK